MCVCRRYKVIKENDRPGQPSRANYEKIWNDSSPFVRTAPHYTQRPSLYQPWEPCRGAAAEAEVCYLPRRGYQM